MKVINGELEFNKTNGRLFDEPFDCLLRFMILNEYYQEDINKNMHDIVESLHLGI